MVNVGVQGRATRRQLLLAGLRLAGAIWLVGCGPPPSAPPALRPARVGYLSVRFPNQRVFALLLDRLRILGYQEGENLEVERRFAEGQPDRLAILAAELVSQPVDVIVAENSAATRAAMEATRTIPIVMVAVSSPVESGLVASLAQPGGNVTGFTNSTRALIAKRLELLVQMSPSISSVAVFWNPTSPDREGEIEDLEAAARSMGVRLQWLDVRGPDDLAFAFEEIRRGQAEALYRLDSTLGSNLDRQIAAFSLQQGLPAIGRRRDEVEEGFLLAYGPNRPHLYVRAAEYVHRILQGARPAELPVEQPVVFDLAINLDTAAALQLSLPDSVLAIATDILPSR